MPSFRLIATLLLVASTALSARADDASSQAAGDALRGQTKFKAFGSEEGLNNLVIGGIAQDPSGLLWVATDEGVYRFDGERFVHFSAAQGLISSLNFAVGIAPGGAPCVGSPNGLVCWNGTQFSQVGTRGLPKASVHSMVTFAGKLWVGTDRGGLYVQDGAGGFIRAPGWPGGPTAKIRGLWADASGLVVGDGEAVELTAGDGVWQVLDVGIRGEQIEAVLRDRDGTLWVRTPLHMWMWPRGAAHPVDVTDGLPTGYDMVDAATPMAIGPRGEVMVGTDGGIAYREGDHWRLIDRSAGLPAGATRTLFVDREGTLWVGAAALLQRRGRDLIEYWGVASGLPGETAWSFRRDVRGTLWVGTNRCLARAIAGRWDCLPGSEGRTVRSMVFPPQGGVFIGGAPSDLLYIDGAGVATSLGHGDRPANSHILALALGPEGDLWIGTRAGLFRLRGAIVPGPLERVIVPGVRPDFRAVSFAVVGGQLWVGSEEGIVVLDRGTWHLLDRRSGLRETATSYLAPRADGRMCVAYREAIGVSCFRYDNGTATAFEHIGPDQGLASGMVYLFGEDREHRLWIGTGNGVDVVTPSGIDHFDNSDGIAGNDSSANAFLLDGDGSLWLGSSGGATHLRAQLYGGPPPPPRTVFLDAQLGGQSVASLHGALEVPHDRNALALELASSSLIAPRRVSYQIRLSPLEQDWSLTPRQVRFAGLAHDVYRLEVRSRIGAGSWGPTAEFGFAVLPAWWHTRWFMVLIAILGLGAIAGGFTWRQRTVLRRRTRQLHDQADATFRAVVDLMPDLIAVHRDRELIYLNRANRRFLGIDDTGVQRRAQPLIDRVHPDDQAQVAELFRRVGQADPEAASDVVEMRMTGPDGSWRACEISAVRVELGGAPVVVTSSRDVTERKRMRAKLIVSDRMASLGTLAAGIAHEINNPLAYVAGNLEAVAETFQSTHHQPSHADCVEMSAAVNDARDGAERVRRIVQGLRTFSRSEDEKRTPLALVDVLDAAIRLTGNELRHRARLVRELGPVPLVVADDGRLTQVFINLLINAAHAIPEGHSDDNCITVRTRTDEAGRAVVEVADTGKGMAPEVQARVFDPFFTTKDVGEGTGLGLSICHGIVSGLGGQISIDSAPGRGTLVRVVLPAKPRDVTPAPAPAAVSEPVAAGNDARRHRVMLIDDEPQVVQTTERLLRKDYDVTVAVCGKDALALIAQGARFDAIISDVMMPNMTGIDLFEELQRMAPDQAQRVVFLSGGAFTAQTRERLDQLGVPQLEKPVTAKQLRDCVLRIVSDASRCEP